MKKAALNHTHNSPSHSTEQVWRTPRLQSTPAQCRLTPRSAQVTFPH